MGDISSDLGAPIAVAKRLPIRNDGRSSNGVKEKDFGLLPLEKQIIALIVEGYSTGEAARKIGVSKVALTRQMVGIFDKLHVSNQFELILFARYHQLIETGDSTQPRSRKGPRLKNNAWSESPL